MKQSRSKNLANWLSKGILRFTLILSLFSLSGNVSGVQNIQLKAPQTAWIISTKPYFKKTVSIKRAFVYFSNQPNCIPHSKAPFRFALSNYNRLTNSYLKQYTTQFTSILIVVPFSQNKTIPLSSGETLIVNQRR